MVFGYWGPVGPIPRYSLVKVWHMMKIEKSPHKFGWKVYVKNMKIIVKIKWRVEAQWGPSPICSNIYLSIEVCNGQGK